MLPREGSRVTAPGQSLRATALVPVAQCGGRMNTDTTAEPLPASPPAPDTTRRTTLYLLLAATVAALLQIPFTRARAS